MSVLSPRPHFALAATIAAVLAFARPASAAGAVPSDGAPTKVSPTGTGVTLSSMLNQGGGGTGTVTLSSMLAHTDTGTGAVTLSSMLSQSTVSASSLVMFVPTNPVTAAQTVVPQLDLRGQAKPSAVASSDASGGSTTSSVPTNTAMQILAASDAPANDNAVSTSLSPSSGSTVAPIGQPLALHPFD